MAARETTKTDSRLAARCAAVASLGAAVIHVAVAPMHWRDWLPSGVFFAALATFQLIWAFLAWSRPGVWVLAAGIATNATAATLWVMSCLIGPPVGPSAGQPEAVGAAGICVLLLQIYVVMGAAWSWLRKFEPEAVSGFGRALVLVGANTVMAGAVTVGLAASLQGHHNHHHGGATEAQGSHHATHDAHIDGGMHTEADRHREGNHKPAELQPAPAVGARTPAPASTPENGLPVTDMALDTDDDDHQGEAVAPSAGGASQPAPAAAAPATQEVPAQPAPAQSQTAAGDSGHDEADGHQHHHED